MSKYGKTSEGGGLRGPGTSLQPVRRGWEVGSVAPPRSGSGPGAADEGGLHVYTRILRQHWRTVLVTFLVVSAAVTAGTLLSPKVYRATATLEIRRQAAEVVPVEAFSQFERISDQYLQTQYSVLRGPALVRRVVADRALAERLAGLAGLLNEDRPELPEPGTPGADTMAARLSGYINEHLVVDAIGTSRLVRIHLELEDPVLAADVVNALVDEYLAVREEAAATTLANLGEQADSVRTDLLAAEEGLLAFVRENGLSGVVSQGEEEAAPVARLRLLEQELTTAETEAYRTEALAGAAKSTPTGLTGSELVESLRERVAELEGEYARLRATFTDDFPRTQQVKTELTQLREALTREESRILGGLEGDHEATLRRRDLLRGAVAQQRLLVDTLSAKMAEYERLRRDLRGQEQLYAALQQKQKEAAISASLSMMDVAVLNAAESPLEPISPLPKRDLPLGALLGLGLGVGLAFLRHVSDRSVRTVDDVQGVTGAPLLATIPITASDTRLIGTRRPVSGDRREQSWHRIDRVGASPAALDEAFSGLRTSVLYDVSGPDRRTLLITSSRPGEGKTTVSTNLAISLARLGRSVLLVDADVRRPSLHHVFSTDGAGGLSRYLMGAADWPDVVQPDVVDGLDLIPAGGPLENPPDRLSSTEMRRLVAEAQDLYDFVLLDAPGLFVNVPDARILAHLVDGTILVIRSGAAERDVVQRVAGQVDNLMGVVLNQLDERHLPGYYHGYGAGGAAETGEGAAMNRQRDMEAPLTRESVVSGDVGPASVWGPAGLNNGRGRRS